jgi:UDP-2,4-diacetamido-2,4,6-trideoxy-beta-L-altropyranose hydrolase
MSPLRVALRADASPEAGTGHVRRCLALAAALRECGAQVRLVTRPLGVDTVEMARTAGVETVQLPPSPPRWQPPGAPVARAHCTGATWQDDALQTAEAMGRWACTWMIVDHYAFDARWQRQVAQALGTRLAAIDDLADRPHEVEFLIDHNLHADHRQKYGKLVGAATRLLGGPRYALLGPAYGDLHPVQVADTVSSIGVFMGGVDSADLGALALRACREQAAFRGPIEIAATSACPHLDSLEALASRWPHTRVSVDQPDLAAFFTRHSLQIGAGGGASWERCCAGAPMLLLQGAANQSVVVRELAAIGGAATLAEGEELSVAAVGRAVAALLADAPRRRALAQRARGLVDGLGAHRVAVALAADTLALRPALPDDAERSFSWRNDESTRHNSRDPRQIEPADHRRWWLAALADPRRRLFVAHVGARDVGVLRFDVDDAQAEVSIYLDPALTGLGLGTHLLRAGQRWARENTALQRLVATILPGNRASLRAFEDVGFVCSEPSWTWRVTPESTALQGNQP